MPKAKVKSLLPEKVSRKFSMLKMLYALSAVFFVVWIIIGLFIAAVIVQGLRRGEFQNMLASKSVVPQAVEPPTETTLPGIGKINIACAEKALSGESIQKLVANYDVKVLTEKEQEEFAKCVLEKASPVPSPSPN